MPSNHANRAASSGQPGANIPQTIPQRNFHKIIRVAYWINADNPIGSSVAFTPDIFYTCSVGYGPNGQGQTMRAMRTSMG